MAMVVKGSGHPQSFDPCLPSTLHPTEPHQGETLVTVFWTRWLVFVGQSAFDAR